MNEITIEKHNFNLIKERLKEFSEITDAELAIDSVKTDGGFFGMGNHKVTGSELNCRLGTIQENFIKINTTSNKIIKEFREVYNALDVLDKDYITSIVANVKAIEKTSNDVRTQQGTLKQHNEKLLTQQSKLDTHQAEIEKNVSNISKIVTALKVFKEKLEEYKHLTDIDNIWNDCKSIQREIRVVSDDIADFSQKITADIAMVDNNNRELSDLVDREILILRNETKFLRELLEDLSKKIEVTASLLDKQIPIIQESATFSEYLKKIVHIHDIDSMWKDVETHTAQITQSEKRGEELTVTIQKNKEEVNENIAEVIQTTNENFKTLTKKVKCAYWVAGSSVGLAVFELILLLLKVL